ncbi:MarR family winged helix-turn-helix transcriptional regulator [Roseovarius sp. ZX-A-9]|uniref:MarR family winged helix-turn-helix transcriptional regulator n=1 Tax=Roseovarius sp. ZX-A-9 TaxID=3014783 RepID=UPI00232ECA5B|nr:MarR family transcriptional regulator [Roseovarius sp. ZX-A-9]
MANPTLPDLPKRPENSLGRKLTFASGACLAMCQKLLEPHALTLAQWVLLSALWQRDGLLVSQLAAYSGNAAPATSRIVDRMEEKGLLRRAREAEDRRVVRVFLTDEGRALSRLDRFHETVNDALLDGFTAAEAAMLHTLLERVEFNARRRLEDAT